jgi:hypothetical protein
MEQPEPQSDDASSLSVEGDHTMDFSEWKLFVDELKKQWKSLWWTRIDDEVRAEGIASEEFPKLFTEKGTVIVATKDYKPPSFHEILTRHMPESIADQINSAPYIGGLGKFIREMILGSRRVGRREAPPKPSRPRNGQRKHGGRGWVHYSLE